MSDRGASVRTLADDLSEHPDVSDAWTAKHFSDRLLVVEVAPDERLPAPVRTRLHERGLREANEVYDVDAVDADFAGELTDCRRYRFVDVREREQLQSYVVG